MSGSSLDNWTGKLLYYVVVVGVTSLLFFAGITSSLGRVSADREAQLSVVLGLVFGSVVYGLFLAWRVSIRGLRRSVREINEASNPSPPSMQQQQEISSLDPTKPLFSYSFTPSVIYYLVIELLIFLFYFPAVIGFNLTDPYSLAVAGVFAATFLYAAARRWFVKVRTYKFYQNSFELSGWRFRKQFSYQDISRISLQRRGFWFLAEPSVMFTFKDEFVWFSLKNVLNKRINIHLYNWLAAKLPPTAQRTTASMVFQ